MYIMNELNNHFYLSLPGVEQQNRKIIYKHKERLTGISRTTMNLAGNNIQKWITLETTTKQYSKFNEQKSSIKMPIQKFENGGGKRKANENCTCTQNKEKKQN